MKILMLTSYSSVYGGNFIPSLEAFAQYSIKRGDSVGFALNTDAQGCDWCKELQQDYSVYFVKNKGIFEDVTELNRYIKENDYDCVYAHFSYYKLACVLSLLNHSLAIICHQHTDSGSGSKLTLKRKLLVMIKKTLFYRNMSLIFVSKRLQRLELMEGKGNGFWLPNAIVTTRFDKSKGEAYRNEMRHTLKIAENAPVILMFGWDIIMKGVDIALLAFQKLLRVQPNAYLMIVAGAKDGKAGVRKFAENIIDNETLKRVVFLEPSQDVEKYHCATDVFLSSSRSESFSYAILEALCLGERVVTSDLEGVRWSEKYKTVEFFPSENVEACAEKLYKSIGKLDDCNHEELVETSVKAEKDYDIETWCENVYKIISSQYRKKIK